MTPEIPDFFQSKVRKNPYSRKKLARRRIILRILAGVLPPAFAGIYSKVEASWLDLSKITLPFRGIHKREKLKLLHTPFTYMQGLVVAEIVY